METPISFELSKLLKEKGFKQGFGNGQKFYFPDTKELTENHRGDNYPAPTIAEVVMWLYEKHGIWIAPLPTPTKRFVFGIYRIEKPFELVAGEMKKSFNSPTEAYEAAIEYVLKNLI